MEISIARFRRILYTLAVVAAGGAAFAFWLRQTYAGQPDVRNAFNAFYVLFARNEGPGLIVVALFCMVSALIFFRDSSPQLITEAAPGNKNLFSLRPSVLVFIIAAGVVALTALGTTLVCHNYALSADEFMADFQARIFLHGDISAIVPVEWRDAVRVIKPTYAEYLPATHSWKAAYLPVYAAMRALFQAAYLQSLLNPLLAGITLIALSGVLQRIWPNEKRTALAGILLLAGSSQFLVMSMTSYSMPAHLALNTIWLWLYLQPKSRLFWLAPVVGVLAIGLHQPVVHALFVTPFLFRLLLQRRWKVVLTYGFLYSLGCASWLWWGHRFSAPGGPPASLYFSIWNPKMLIIQPMDLWLVLAWMSLATPLLIVLGCRSADGSKPVVQDAALSCFLTFLFYYFFRLDQGNGWGYRYLHGTLSCAVIVAVAGWKSLVHAAGPKAAWRFLVAGLAASFLIQLPLRCFQAESYIRPFAQASESIHAISAGVVGVDPDLAWYSADLVRNDPYLTERPVVFALIKLKPTEVRTLAQHGPARFLKQDELQQCGLVTTQVPHPKPAPFRVGIGP